MAKKQKQKGEIIKSPHEEFFKSIIGDISTARDFLEQYLPGDFKESVDLSKIKVKPESFVEKSLRIVSLTLYIL